jgi:aldehyde dehydrogenase (NAD+)
MSGQGRENGEAALEHYTELKTVTIQLPGPAAAGGG